MQLRLGYELHYELPQPTPMLLTLNVHFTRVSDLLTPDHVLFNPSVASSGYRDGFGNWCTRVLAPAGRLLISTDCTIRDSGQPDIQKAATRQVPVEELPEEALVHLLPSRFCDSDRLLDLAWTLFGGYEPGWGRVQAICDFTHRHIAFGYEHARVTRTASEAYEEGRGVCRDYAHLAIAFCRALNIPARYCTGYLGDIGVPPSSDAMDFSAWFQAYLGGRWYTFDPRNNVPRIGRVLIGYGRDAADVPISHTFGPNELKGFVVWTDDVTA